MVYSINQSLTFFSRPVIGRMLAIFLPVGLLTGAVVFSLYYFDLAKDQTLYGQSGSHLVRLQADIIDRELHSVESDLRYLAGQAVLRNYLSGNAANKKELEEEYVLLCRERGVYDQIRYLDAQGQERIRINYNDGRPSVVPEKELQSKANRYYFTQTMSLAPGGVFVSPLDLNVEHDEVERPFKPVIRFATPVLDQKNSKVGVLILNYLGQELIHKLAEVSVNFAGSAWLLNREGYFLRGPSAGDEWGFMFEHGRRFADYYPEEWKSVAMSGQGQIQTDRGLFSFQTLFPPLKVTPERQVSLTKSEDQDLADAGLIVVAHVPPYDLSFRANQLLRQLLLLWGVVLIMLLILAWYLAKAANLRRNHEQTITESESRLRLLSSQLITVQEDERRRLSRDLHDELGQIVTTISLDLQRAAQAIPNLKKDELISQASQATASLLDKIHEISLRIRPTLLDDLGLKDAVQSLLSDYERRTGITTQTDLTFQRSNVPRPISENVFRILQEALNNVAKHSKSKEVSVKLDVQDRRLFLMVLDRGTGFLQSQVNGKGLGLLGMRERTELLNGDFLIQAESGKGTQIQVTVPLPESSNAESVYHDCSRNH
jgi:signal transduction histidine kinase